MKLHLIRHGESTLNAAGVVSGQLDACLTDKGRQQAIAVAETLPRTDVVFSSSLRRARDTADTIFQFVAYPKMVKREILISPDLNERDYGVTAGTNHSAKFDPSVLLRTPLGGESFLMFVARVQRFLRNELEHMRTLKCSSATIVSHHATLSVLDAIVRGETDALKAACSTMPNCTHITRDWSGDTQVLFPVHDSGTI